MYVNLKWELDGQTENNQGKSERVFTVRLICLDIQISGAIMMLQLVKNKFSWCVKKLHWTINELK
jgi:hypothetical protein